MIFLHLTTGQSIFKWIGILTATYFTGQLLRFILKKAGVKIDKEKYDDDDSEETKTS